MKKLRPPKGKRPAPGKAGGADEQVRWLLHELQVHSEEITVQNEQLIKAQAEIEVARDRYAELYDFAPVGYVLLDKHGAIHECNFAACALLGKARRFLVKVPLSALVISDHRAKLREFLQHAFTNTDGRPPELAVELKATHHQVRLIARPRASGEDGTLLLTALVDMTLERKLDNELRAALAREQSRARQLGSEVAERTRAEIRVKGLLDRLVSVQEEERRRLARDLHDQLGQQLTALRLTLSVLRQELPAGSAAQQQLDAADAIATRLDRDVDFLAWELRPTALDEFGLVAALATLAMEWRDYHRIPVDFDGPSTSVRLARDAETHVYRIVQEALNNIVKHSHAQHVRVRLEQTGHALRITIEDDGRGFDTALTGSRPGMGLLGMRERAALIDGLLQIESTVSKGTTVMLRVPIPPQTA